MRAARGESNTAWAVFLSAAATNRHDLIMSPRTERISGTLASWNDERGFGFISPAQRRATRFQIAGRSTRRMPRRTSRRRRPGAASYLVILGFVIGYVTVNARWPLPYWVAGIYLVASIVCFNAYAADKFAATAGRWRVSENTLLLLGVVGGWPGAIVAQQTLRHKMKKASFRSTFWGSVVVNLIVFMVFSTPAFALFAAASARPLF